MKLVALKPEECTGCRTCELICALHNYQENNPAKAALRVRGLFPDPATTDPAWGRGISWFE